MAGFWQQAHGRVPDGYPGRIIAPTEADIALLCGESNPAELDIARRQAAELSRQVVQLRTEMTLLSEQVTDRDEQILRLRRQLEQAETGKASWKGTAQARQEALERLRIELSEAHRAREADDQRLADVQGELQKVQGRATRAAAEGFTLDVDTPPDWSTLGQSPGDRLRGLRDKPAPATATPGLRILARHLLEHAIEHGNDLDQLVATANISPEVIEPLLTAALLPGRDTVLAVAAACSAEPDRTTQLYEQARAEQNLRDTAENPARNPATTRVTPGENPFPPTENPALTGDLPRRPAPPDRTTESHPAQPPAQPQITRRRVAIAVILALVAGPATISAIQQSSPKAGGSTPTATSPTTVSAPPTTSSPTTSSTPATPRKTVTGHGDGTDMIVSRDGHRRATTITTEVDADSYDYDYSDTELRVWNVKSGKRVRAVDLDGSPARIALSTDGSYLAAIVVSHFQFRWTLISLHHTLHVWNVATGDQIVKRDIDVQRGKVGDPPFLTRRVTLRFLKGTTLLSSNDIDDDDHIDDHIALMNATNGATIGTQP